MNGLEKWLYKNKAHIVKFHFDLSNCLDLIMEGYQQWSIYCFLTKLRRNVRFAKCSQHLRKKEEWFKKIG